jgi:phasin family protein
MSIFNDLMEGAKAHIASLGKLPDADAAKKQADICRTAAEKAFGNMTALAEAAKNANQDAFAVIESRVKDSIAELNPTVS